MARTGFVFRFLKLGTVAALLAVIAACGRGDNSARLPTILVQPQSASIQEGGRATFSVAAAGEGTLAYQWQRDGTYVPGTTGPTYTTDGETFSASGVRVRVRVNNEFGTVFSDDATLTVTAQCTGKQPNTGWCRVGALATYVYDLAAVDESTAWAVREDDTYATRLAKTTDGGISWTPAQLPQQVDSVSAVSATVVWATGRPDPHEPGDLFGLALRSVDGGRTWTSRQVGNCADERWQGFRIRPVDGTVAWAEDCDRIYRTVDGGSTWIVAGYRFARGLAPVDAAVVWALPHGLAPDRDVTVPQDKILLSVDGGTSWATRPMPLTQPAAVAPINARTAWVVGSGAILKTTDGGLNWIEQYRSSAVRFTGAHAVDADTVWVEADGGLVFRTVNGGRTWEPRAPAGPVSPVSASVAWSNVGTVVRTLDGGATWKARSLPGAWKLAVAGPDTVWAAYGSALARTVDGGASWSVLRPFWTGPSGIAAAGTDTLWAVQSFGSGSGSQIAVTHDVGRTWIRTTRKGTNLWDAVAADAATAWACCDGGLLATADGGASWATLTGISWTSSTPYGFAASSRSVLWQAGRAGDRDGTVYRSSDGGVNWALVLYVKAEPPVGDPPYNDDTLVRRWFTNVAAVDDLTAWAVGLRGMIYKSSDGGATWTSQSSGTTLALWAVAAVDASTAWAVGDRGTILATVDGGRTWVAQAAGTAENLWDVAAADRRIVWIASTGSGLLKTVSGGE